MKTLLGIACALNLVAAVFLLSDSFTAAFAAVGCALLAGTGFAILDRLDKIVVELKRPRMVETPPRTAIPPPLAPLPPIQEFDAAKAVAAMEEARRLSRPS